MKKIILKNINLHELDTVTKVLLIMFIGTLFYIIIFSIIKPFFITKPTPLFGMMSQMMRADVMNFSGTASATMNSISLLVALGITILVSFYLFRHTPKNSAKPIAGEERYALMKKGLSSDEKRLLDEIKKAGEITQDSLRFRLDWSKAKVSTLLTNLDRAGFIQRERVGKTYNICLQKSSNEQS